MEVLRHTLGQATHWLVMAAIFWGTIWFFARNQAQLWRSIAARFGRLAGSAPIASMKAKAIVIARRSPDDRTILAILIHRQHASVHIHVHETGIGLSVGPIRSTVMNPIFVPFDDMTLVPTSWMLWPDPYALRMRGLENVEIILDRETVRWLQAHLAGAAPAAGR